MMTDAFAAFHSSAVARINQVLEHSLDRSDVPTELQSAMHYAVMNGGKRLRPTLAYASFAAASKISAAPANNGAFAAVDATAAALELVHSYSLVHDDLPAMDDDALRRGKPSCHVAFGEATAILAGDALQALAFELLADQGDKAATLCGSLARAAGPAGMVGGQMLDLSAVGLAGANNAMEQAALETMHRAKTGALICAAAEMGAICAAAPATLRQSLRNYASNIGLAFQVVDDVLDVTASTETLGKPQGADAALEKPTYPDLLGLEASRDYARQLCETAQAHIQDVAPYREVLHGLADYIICRSH